MALAKEYTQGVADCLEKEAMALIGCATLMRGGYINSEQIVQVMGATAELLQFWRDRIAKFGPLVCGARSAAEGETMGEWTSVAGIANTPGLTVRAYWEGDPARITRVSVIGACSGVEAEDAVRCVLRAYGSTSEPRIEWEAGEWPGQQVAFLRV